mgnify:CR=1 FL=1
MTITEKVAYLKGLAEGLAIDTEKSKEGKLIRAIIDVLEDMGLSIEDLEATTDEMAEEMDAISDDLADVEDDLYGEEDDDYEDEDEFFQVECPNCGELLEIDEEALDLGGSQCPSCQQKFVLDIFDDCDDECGCGCGCDHDHAEVVEDVVEEPQKPAKKSAKKSESKKSSKK